MEIKDLYGKWLEKATDSAIQDELKSIGGDDAKIRDRFFKSLEFGTGGLRGVLGAGTNRMNIYTIGMTAQALADYLNNKGIKNAKVAIGHDSRIMSDVFARTSAAVLAMNGIHAYLFPQLVPTPVVSFAIRELGCDGGVCITASHNPSEYNGFKCYGADGCQMTDFDAGEVSACMEKLDIFDDVKHGDFDALLAENKIEFISEDVCQSYINNVLSCEINGEACKNAGLSVVYTPLCGAGNRFVREVLDRAGIKNVTVVAEQEKPDGTFPGCPYPNPEIREAFNLALKLAESVKPELLLATDPDSDRVGIAVLKDGDYVLMSGNEVGAMLVNYVLSSRLEKGTLPKNPVVIKSIVTSDLGARIAESYGCECRNVLTGFKYIGEQMTELLEAGEVERFIMGWEESYGYLAGSYARDKDAVVASMLICEMASYYKLQGKSLLDVMHELYEKYGYFCHRLCNYGFKGEAGLAKMKEITDKLRANPLTEIAGLKVAARRDYLNSIEIKADGTTSEINLPKSNVLVYIFENGGSLIVRPSGTEPKMKIYLTAVESSREAGAEMLDRLEAEANKIAE